MIRVTFENNVSLGSGNLIASSQFQNSDRAQNSPPLINRTVDDNGKVSTPNLLSNQGSGDVLSSSSL